MASILPAVALTPMVAIWQGVVSRIVTEPYLDEFFHVRQAQIYCHGHFDVWDPKITTPPGLYLMSWLIFRVTGRCDITALRLLNTLSLIGLPLLVAALLALTSTTRAKHNEATQRYHSALNVALFPPFFFFSALYYTDVVSTILVLTHYYHTLRGLQSDRTGPIHGITTIIIGSVSLSFRQTNIFWVAVFPAGLTAVHHLSAASATNERGRKKKESTREWSTVKDIPVDSASIEDYFYFVIALVLTALKHPWGLIKKIVPHICLIGLFSAFVAWNGGVVLGGLRPIKIWYRDSGADSTGDKSNHVATIHVSQMLYLWPYIIFFSFPLVLPTILKSVLPYLPRQYVPASLRGISSNKQHVNLSGPRTVVLLLTSMIVGLVVVHFNTIVHPFTLADNRHYVFYVFRLLLRHQAIKYIAVPVYIVCAWLAIQSVGTDEIMLATGQTPSSAKRKTPISASGNGGIGFFIVWLASTSLSVITAPLVEPRYFIIPWAMWRINASPRISKPEEDHRGTASSNARIVAHTILALESVWYLLIDLGTGYMFLYRGFEWSQEPGKVQRFMW